MRTPAESPPWSAQLAISVSHLSGVPLVFLALLAVSHDDAVAEGGHWWAMLLLLLAVGQFTGAARLNARRGRRLLVGASVASVVGCALVALVESMRAPADGAAGVLVLLAAGPAAAALLASSSGARRWAGPAAPPPSG